MFSLSATGRTMILVILATAFHPGSARAQHHQHERHAAVHHRHKKAFKVRTYQKCPRLRTRVAVVPPQAIVIAHKRTSYRFHGGIFYKPVGSAFIVVTPPVGIRVNVLPESRRLMVVRGISYFYYYGTFYARSGSGYKVVRAPAGAQVDTLPEGYEEVEAQGETLIRVDDTCFRPAAADGKEWYEVVDL